MKFTINGREYEDNQLSNEQIVDLIDGDNTLDFNALQCLTNKVYERFKRSCCARKSEDGHDELFARNFSDYVNSCPNNFKRAANEMARDHRYLQSEMFKVFIEYAKILAENASKGIYDGRNEWACKTAKIMIDALKEVNHPF